MTVIYAVLAAVTVWLFIYLLVAMFKPELFP